MKTKIHAMYLMYVNDFLTVESFARFLGLSVPETLQIIRIGKRLNNRIGRVK